MPSGYNTKRKFPGILFFSSEVRFSLEDLNVTTVSSSTFPPAVSLPNCKATSSTGKDSFTTATIYCEPKPGFRNNLRSGSVTGPPIPSKTTLPLVKQSFTNGTTFLATMLFEEHVWQITREYAPSLIPPFDNSYPR